MGWSIFKKSKPQVFKSKFNDTIHVAKSFGKKALFAKGVAQSGGEYNVMWQEAFKNLSKDFRPKTCLCLGVAAGTVIEVIHNQYPQTKITGVEIDPIIIEVAKEEFGLTEDKKTKIIIADAITWVERNKDKKFDLIIIDLYIGAFNPKGSRREIYLKRIQRMLKKDGIAFYNAHFEKEKPEEFDRFLKSCKKIFAVVTIVFTYPKNRILLIK